MDFIKRPAENVDEWIKLTNSSKSHKNRVIETSSILLDVLADWELNGQCRYLTERIKQLRKLIAEQERAQNNPMTTPEEGADLQNKINKLNFEGNAVLLWLEMSDAERMTVCRAFDKQHYFDSHKMGDQFIRRLWKLQNVDMTPNAGALLKFKQFFVG